MTGNRKQFRSAIVRLAHTQKFLATHGENEGDRGKGFGIVDSRWLAVQTIAGREWRLVTGLTFFAFERLEQSGLFTANVGTIAVVREKLKAEFGTEYFLP